MVKVRCLIALLLVLLSAQLAYGVASVNTTTVSSGQVPTASDWNTYLNRAENWINSNLLNSGNTFTIVNGESLDVQGTLKVDSLRVTGFFDLATHILPRATRLYRIGLPTRLVWALHADTVRAAILDADTLAGTTILGSTPIARPSADRSGVLGLPTFMWQSVHTDSLIGQNVTLDSLSITSGIDSTSLDDGGVSGADLRVDAVDSTRIRTGSVAGTDLAGTLSGAKTWTGAQTYTNTNTFNVGIDSRDSVVITATSGPGNGLLHVNSSNVQPLAVIQSTGANSYPGIDIYNDARRWRLQNNGTVSTDPLEIYDVTASASRMVVDNVGQVAMGSTDAAAALSPGNSRLFLRTRTSGAGLVIGVAATDTATNAKHFRVNNGATYSEMNAGDASFTTSSDSTKKTNITTINPTTIDILRKLRSVPIVTYTWRPSVGPDTAVVHVGMLAQHWYTIGKLLGSSADSTQIKWETVTAALLLAVKQLDSENQGLRARNNIMQATLDSFRVRIEALEAR